MATAFDVAAYILKKKGPVTHMKLQKLVYYSQAWALVWNEEPLFKEKIEAWANGPVVRNLFTKLRTKYRVHHNDVHPKGDESNLTQVEKDTIDRIIEFYGDKNSQWLSDLTHMESPWQEARLGVPAGARSTHEISHASMAMYYSSL